MAVKHTPTDLPQATAIIILQDNGFAKFSATVTYLPRHELLTPEVVARIDEKSPAVRMAKVIMQGIASGATRAITQHDAAETDTPEQNDTPE